MLRRLIAFSSLVAALSGCGELTDHGPCAESTRDWWPVRKGARWTYRITRPDAEAAIGFGTPEVGWKEHEIEEELVEIGGLAGTEMGSRMRVTDPDDSEWDWSWQVLREDSYRWARKLFFKPEGTEEEAVLEDYYTPARTRMDFSKDRVCVGSRWHDDYVHHVIAIGEVDPDVDAAPCERSMWVDDPWACDRFEEREGTTWTVVEVDAALRLFGDRVFFEHALCLRRLDDDGINNSLYCWVRGVGKILECEERFGKVYKVEELCRSCVPPDECPWAEEPHDSAHLPSLCVDGFWEYSRCEDAFLR